MGSEEPQKRLQVLGGGQEVWLHWHCLRLVADPRARPFGHTRLLPHASAVTIAGTARAQDTSTRIRRILQIPSTRTTQPGARLRVLFNPSLPHTETRCP